LPLSPGQLRIQRLFGFFVEQIMRVLSGIQPTGRFHWGNYFGAIRQYIALQGNEQAFYFIADLHALTTIRDGKQLLDLRIAAALDLLALGLDPARACLFFQSDVPEVCELTWLLMTVTPLGLLEKCHAFKDKKAKGLPADAGLFTYPVLMAADILLYDSTVVPVGADQVQHIEVTRDLALKFNHLFGEVFVLPEARVLDESAKVPGTDGEKMSKSYGNTIDVFEPEKKLRKKIMAIKTDSTPVESPKDPDACSVFTLYKLFATLEQQAALAELYRAGGMGYGEAKQALFEAANAHFAPARARREELESDLDQVRDILADGARRARAKGREVLERAAHACGLGRWSRSR
jgi:tryptophanyl-tRNA synthetase